MKTRMLAFFLVTACFGKAQTVTDHVSVPNPGSIETDAAGNLWVNYRTSGITDTFYVAKITPSGVVTPVIKETYELGPFGVNDDFIWVSSTTNGIVYKYDHTGVKLDSVYVTSPAEILLEQDGSWHLSQSQAGRLVKYDAANLQTVIVSGFPLDNNTGLTRDENGIFYTCNRFNGDVIRIDPVAGTKTVIAPLPFISPYSVGFISYHDGYLYASSGLNCVYRIDTAGIGFDVFTGTEGMAGDVCGSIGDAQFDAPMGVAFSVTGDTLFVSDENSGKIKAISGMNTLGAPAVMAQNNGLAIYPNPSCDVVTISAENETVSEFTLTDSNGKNLEIPYSTAGGLTTIDVSHLLRGSYFLHTVTESGKICNAVLLKT